LKLDRKYELLVVDVKLVHNHKDEELSYHNERYFVTLYPGLSLVIERTFLTHTAETLFLWKWDTNTGLTSTPHIPLHILGRIMAESGRC